MEGKHIYARKVAALMAVLFLCMAAIQPAVAQEVLSDTKKKSVNTSSNEAPEPEKTTTESTNKWLLYGGVAALAVGVAAIAGGGGGGSSAPPCEEGIVGPDLNGSDWSGRLTLQAEGVEGMQEVKATITHCGSSVLISTNSQLAYGQTYDGTISSGGSMLVVEHVRRQDWTTHFFKATSTTIELYDFVNDLNDFDSLLLYR